MCSSVGVSVVASIVAVPKPIADENVRAERLLDAQDKAAQLFDEIERREMIRPGVGEKAVVRRDPRPGRPAARGDGPLASAHRARRREHPAAFREHPPDRVVADGDIVFLDLGPIFEEWEADFGRTFVLGDDPDKLAIRDALPRVWRAGRDYFESHLDITGAELYDYVVGLGPRRRFRVRQPDRRPPARGVSAQEDRRHRRPVVHHARIEQADATQGPRAAGSATGFSKST